MNVAGPSRFWALAGLCLAGLTLLTGCVSPQAQPGHWETVVNSRWVLDTMEGRSPLVGSDPSPTPMSLELSRDGRAAGFAGVNRFFGSYESTPEGSIRFAALGATRMFRDDPPGLMDQEQRFLTLLGQVDGYRIQHDKLVLLEGRRKSLVFVSDPAQDTHADK